MRLVLHVGMGKTGTSSLQATFGSNRRTLAEHGIVYPDMGKGPSHGLLTAVVKPFARRPRFYDAMRPEEWSAASAGIVAALVRSAERKPRVMIISTEYLFELSLDEHAILASLMRLLTDQIRVVAWLREPIDYYRSYIHQLSKTTGLPHRDRSPPAAETFSPKLRDRVGRLWEVWGKEAVALHLYDQSAMVDGDIVSDFVARAVPEAKSVPLKPVRRNVDFPAELDAAVRIALQRSCADDIAFMHEIGLLPCSSAARSD